MSPVREATDNRFATELFTPLAARYDLLCELLSFGQNRRWRTCMVSRALDGGPASVLDVASGTAGVAIALARRSKASVVAYDLTRPMLEEGARRITAAGLSGRVAPVQGRAEELPFSAGRFDALTFTYLLRYVQDPAATVAELARVVRPGGTVASLEFLVPPRQPWRAAWWCYTRLVLPLGGWLTGGRQWARVGRFLGPNITAFYRRHPLDQLVEAWRAAGLEDVGVRVMSLGGGVVMWGRKGAG